jgi:putative redox protein
MKGTKPPTVIDLVWTRDLTFSVTTATSTLTLDGSAVAGPSPVDALAAALAGCMTTDVTDLLVKGRHPLHALRSHFVADRAQDDPHRFLRAALTFSIEGAVPAAAVERAIALSRDKYCSVWHSMRQDIEFTTAYEIRA